MWCQGASIISQDNLITPRRQPVPRRPLARWWMETHAKFPSLRRILKEGRNLVIRIAVGRWSLPLFERERARGGCVNRDVTGAPLVLPSGYRWLRSLTGVDVYYMSQRKGGVHLMRWDVEEAGKKIFRNNNEIRSQLRLMCMIVKEGKVKRRSVSSF